MKRTRLPGPGRAERGVATVVFVLMVPVLLGMVGFAIDLGRMYARQAELQHVADAAALAAAGKLDGTPAGVSKARTAAQAVLLDSYYDFKYKLGGYWSDQALSFANDPHAASWLSYNDAQQPANAPTSLYVKFDTSKLAQTDGDPHPGAVALTFFSFFGVQVAPNIVTAAVAGKLSTPITPLAVCAMNPNPTGTHPNVNGVGADTLAYGFRVGVSYNLLQLNPTGTTRQAYLVDPVDSPVEKNNVHFTPKYMQPFMCAGSVGLGQVVGRQVYIQALPDDFLGANWNLVDWLNSRFGASNGNCNSAGAPPDSNVREFDGSTNDPLWYMASEFKSPDGTKHPTADWTIRNGKALVAFPDLVAGDTQNLAPPQPLLEEACFGPLWTYSKPKINGLTASTTNWKNMYQFPYVDSKGKPQTVQVTNATANYPTGKSTPYLSHVTKPASGNGVAGRRVLNIPLLDCASNTNDGLGTVVAIGQFFMTGKATKDAIPGEFAGVTNVTGPAVLYR